MPNTRFSPPPHSSILCLLWLCHLPAPQLVLCDGAFFYQQCVKGSGCKLHSKVAKQWTLAIYVLCDVQALVVACSNLHVPNEHRKRKGGYFSSYCIFSYVASSAKIEAVSGSVDTFIIHLSQATASWRRLAASFKVQPQAFWLSEQNSMQLRFPPLSTQFSMVVENLK